MRQLYPQKYCPPELFKDDHNTLILWRGIMDILEAKDIDQRGDWSEEDLLQALRLIKNILGNPEDDLPGWVRRYTDLWQKLITKAMEQSFNYGQSFVNSVYRPISGAILRRLSTQLPQTIVREVDSDLDSPWIYLFSHWHAVGRKVYVTSQGLSQKLKQTKLKGYPADQLKLPFESVYLDLQYYGNVGECETEGCLALQTERTITVTLILHGSSATLFPRLITIATNTGGSIDASLEESLSKYDDVRGMGDIKSVTDLWKGLLSYIVNIILYATMPDAENTFQCYDPNYERLQKRLEKQKSPKKRKQTKRRLEKAASAGYYYLGGSITVDRTEEQQASQGFKGTRRITVRTLVSGHWRNQPCGEGRQEHKRIWIEPFWRGPEGAPITQKVHSLK